MEDPTAFGTALRVAGITCGAKAIFQDMPHTIDFNSTVTFGIDVRDEIAHSEASLSSFANTPTR